MDAVQIHAVLQALRPLLMGARLEGVSGKGRRLLLAWRPRRGSGAPKRFTLAVDLTPRAAYPLAPAPSVPDQPPESGSPFAARLNHKLKSAHCHALDQLHGDRILRLRLEKRDVTGERESMTLLLELFGARPQLLLLGADDRFIDGSHRGVLDDATALQPGEAYAPPPPPDGPPPLLREATTATVEDAFGETSALWLHRTPKGTLPYPVRLSRLDPDPEAGEAGWLDTIARLTREAVLESRRRTARQRVKALRKKSVQRLKNLHGDQARYAPFEQYLAWGQGLLALGKPLPPGAVEAVIIDYHREPPEEIAVPLAGKGSAAREAEHFFHLYKKGKRGLATIEKRLTACRAEVEKWRSWEAALEDPDDDPEALLSLLEEVLPGRRKQKTPSRKKGDGGHSEPRTIHVGGATILIGRSGPGNHHLTFRLAKPRDHWLHVKDYPGSHVVVKVPGGEPGEEVLLRAAALAAFFSRCKEGGKVPVDVTRRKYVQPIPGAAPGQVTYSHQKTLLVVPRGPGENEEA